MRTVMKTKKYQNPETNSSTIKQEEQPKAMYQQAMEAQANHMSDVELLLAMQAARETKYDVCTLAAMQQFISQNEKQLMDA